MKKLTAFLVSLILAGAAAFATVPAFALPSAQDIEQSMSQGNWSTADSQLNQVLQAHPNNARAHYLYGQVLDREGRSADGLAQIQQARKLDPALRFTSPSRFAAVEQNIRARATRSANQVPRSSTFQQVAPAAALVAAPEVHHGPSMGSWIILVLVLIAVVAVVRWGLRRARSNQDDQATDQRRTQLKRATELLNAVRTLKLDLKLSTTPGHEALANEAEGFEGQVRDLVSTLSASENPVPDYQLDEFERQMASLKARAEGRPDPTQAAPSAYAQEAERFGQAAPGAPPAPQQVIVQQQPGGMFGGGGLGGLLTGVLLGNMLGGGRDRVIERDVPVDDELRRGGSGGGLDFGQGDNNWSDGGGIDVGSDNSGGDGWSDT